ncbi:hypothetical protein [Clostridium formicaceticum]|uniref:Uncharacterized protein n=1 Tax=Clostridium formicaceticum TaxID=1497 RepID=A0AAC9WG31_9CLOT|nr:hypothetical protein [Clostridium formicaceticum]AOY76894.1 hypothetical protein BJL90_14150 [Clostridium formicaceticum]ARE87374.1 hypothetical protein CLFO_17740 [Clostridium formicaceticum]
MKRQELLEKLLKKELEGLRKVCFKYQRRPFLRNKVMIVEGDLRDLNAHGLYEQVDVKDKIRYTHKITIDSRVIDELVNYKYNKWDAYAGINKSYYKQKLRQVIRHELTHGMVAEYYQTFSDILGTNCDASPIFLSMLHFCKGISHHQCTRSFRKSKIFEDIKDIKEFSKLDRYLTELIFKYQDIAEDLKMIKLNDKDIVNNTFAFSPRNAGLEAAHAWTDNIVANVEGRVKELVNQSSCFYIGCNITPDMIKNLIDRKVRYGQFEEQKQGYYLVAEGKAVEVDRIEYYKFKSKIA